MRDSLGPCGAHRGRVCRCDQCHCVFKGERVKGNRHSEVIHYLRKLNNFFIEFGRLRAILFLETKGLLACSHFSSVLLPQLTGLRKGE